MKKRLKDIAKVQIGYQLRGRLVNDSNGTHRIIQMRDVGHDGIFDVETLARFTPNGNAGRYIVTSGAVLFQSRGNTNMAWTVRAVPDNTLACNHFFIVIPDHRLVLPEYLTWYLNATPVQALLKSTAQGTTMMLVPKAVFDHIEVELPSLEVQESVARLDSLRRKEQRLVSKLDAKRGMLIEGLCLQAAHREEA